LQVRHCVFDQVSHLNAANRPEESAMANPRWSIVPVLAIALLLLAGCGIPAVAPGPEVRQVLAPTGKLRAGLYPGTPTSIIKDPVSGEPKGVGYDLGTELARRLGVPFEPIVFARNAEVLDAVKTGKVDVAFTNATAARAKDKDFTAPYLEIELGYLVPAGSPISTLAAVDRPGVRVGVTEGSTSDGQLSRELRNAVVVRTPTVKGGTEMLAQRKIDVFATNKATLFEMSDELPGSRVLAGRWGVEQHAIALPKGRDAGMPFARQFAEEAKSGGLVRSAVERAGLRGTVAAGSP
jgi:polar amino acid transport system substrate-binding protein